MRDYEKLGAFYLGRRYDLAAGAATDELVLYDSKDLTTHGVIVGMTGSGKTGLAIGILEEAAIDGIPVIAIDPKGDLSNLALTFPALRPEDFAPWVDPGAATRAGVTVADLAKTTAVAWREGLAKWGQEPERIQRFRDTAEVVLYTPGSTAARPISVLRSFAAPGHAVREDGDALRSRVQTATAGLLALAGIDSDPLRSREHILVATILDGAWREGRDLDLPGIIAAIQSPSFTKIGVFDLESFFPAKERFDLAMRLNALLASPGFSVWMEGDPLDIAGLLHDPAGRPRISVMSIAHLSDAERMFFVTILLNEVLAWVRAQSGTTSLRALLYMDEVFGFFPPTREPPSKQPMLTLLKQARAYGLGVLLATQNPVDLDYKGLGNAGTWFIGRLQTERDKARLLDGLEGASAGQSFDRASLETTLGNLTSRVFLMNNVHEDEPVLMQTRWALSYMRGPLTRDQFALLAGKQTMAAASPVAPATVAARGDDEVSSQQPPLPPEIVQTFLSLRRSPGDGSRVLYRPALLAHARVHFASTKDNIDVWQEPWLLAPVEDAEPDWAGASELAEEPDSESRPTDGAGFATLPAAAARSASYPRWEKALAGHIYRDHALTAWRAPALGELSRPGEPEGAFRVRLQERTRERRDTEVEALRRRWAAKLEAQAGRVAKASEKIAREDAQYSQQKLQSAVSFGASIVGALFGRKLGSVGNVGRATTAARGVGRAVREREDVDRAKQEAESQKKKLAELEQELEQEIAALSERFRPEALSLQPVAVKPRKSDITIERVVLAWTPWLVSRDGRAEPAWS